MNTVLFNNIHPSLTDVINSWFEKNHHVLSPDEDVVVNIKTVVRPPRIQVRVNEENHSKPLEEVLTYSLSIFRKTNTVPTLTVKFENMANNAGFVKIRDLVCRHRNELMKRRDFGKKCLGYVEETLKMIDPRLHIGMFLDQQP